MALTPDERRARVQAVKDGAQDLEQVEKALADVVARAPALLAEVRRIREKIQEAMAPANGGSKDDDNDD